MNYTNLGKTGLKVSRICPGCMSYGLEERKWGLDEEQGRPFIKRALELGINFFDTANMYGNGRSEEVLGRALRDFAKRDEAVIATKVYFPMRPDVNGRGLSRKAIMTEIDQSLRRLGTDYVDLYQINRWDYDTPIEETPEADKPVVERVGEIAKARGVPRAQIALAWLLHKPAVTAPIVGATKLHHLEEAAAAPEVKLSDSEIEALEEPYVPHPIAGF